MLINWMLLRGFITSLFNKTLMVKRKEKEEKKKTLTRAFPRAFRPQTP